MTSILVVFLGIVCSLVNPCMSAHATSMEKQFYSQASQDQFVDCILHQIIGQQDSGYYLEIGAGHPICGNNTYFLEKQYGMQGVSIDISGEFEKCWSSARQNPLLVEDSTQTDYQSILATFPHVIDYLSLDIDSDYDVVLRQIFLSDHIFKVITIEHDFYRFGDKFRKDERDILSSLGYYLLCPDVSVMFNGKDSIFEDWWVHPSAFTKDVFDALVSLDLKHKRHDQLISIIKTLR